MNLRPDVKIRQLDRKLKNADISEQLERLQANQPHQIAAIQSIATRVKGTVLEGLPFTIAMMKAKLLSEPQIAEELGIPLKAVRKYSQVDGFATLVTQMAPAIWSDLQIAAQATIMYHLTVQKDKDLAKWLLESIGQVASSRPMNLHEHKTLVLNGGGGAGMEPKLSSSGTPIVTVEALAEAVFTRLGQNQISTTPPPIKLSEE
jgi:hypothetical protein